jgi:hypothetical protein
LTVHWPSVVPPCKGDTAYHHIVGCSLMARVGPSSERQAVSGKLSRVSSTFWVQRCRRGAPLWQASVIMGRCGWRAPPVSASWSASGRRAHRGIPGHSSRKAGWRSSVACATRLAWAAPSARTARPSRRSLCRLSSFGGMGPINTQRHRAASPLSPEVRLGHAPGPALDLIRRQRALRLRQLTRTVRPWPDSAPQRWALCGVEGLGV